MATTPYETVMTIADNLIRSATQHANDTQSAGDAAARIAAAVQKDQGGACLTDEQKETLEKCLARGLPDAQTFDMVRATHTTHSGQTPQMGYLAHLDRIKHPY